MKKKILHWHDGFDYKLQDGGSVHVQNIITNIKQYDHSLLSEKHFFDFSKQVNKLLHHVKKIKYLSFIDILSDIRQFRNQNRILLSHDFDILHHHGVIFHPSLRNFNNWTGINLYQSQIKFNHIKKPKILTLHNFFPGFNPKKSMIDMYNHYIFEYENIICVDRQIYEYCQTICNERNVQKEIFYIRNSIDTNRFNESFNIESDQINIGFAGRISSTVDLSMIGNLIENLPNNYNFHLAISGDTRNFQIKYSEYPRVHFFTKFGNKDIDKFYKKVDIIFNPVLHSGITRVSMEAMSCAKPVIMYQDYKRDIDIINDSTSFVINRSLSNLINLLNTINLEEIYHKGKNSRKVAISYLSNSSELNKLTDVYNSVLN